MDDFSLFEIEKKVWGTTKCVYHSEFMSQHQLTLKANTFCSFHYHCRRANYFHVEKGIVRIVCVIGYRLFHRDLKSSEFYNVPSYIPHQFQVLESGEMMERYCPDRGGTISIDDITRLSVGGRSSRIAKKPVSIYFADGRVWNEEHSCNLQLCLE